MSSNIRASLINPFLSATLEVLEEVADLSNVITDKPRLKRNSLAPGFMSSIVNMDGPLIKGSYALTLTSTVATELCVILMRDQLKDGGSIKALAKSMLGDISNLVCGKAKHYLSMDNFLLGTSSPRIEVGEKHIIKHFVNEPVIQIPFDSRWGSFYVETSFSEVSYDMPEQPESEIREKSVA